MKNLSEIRKEREDILLTDFIGLAWVNTGDDVVWRLCEFPPFKITVTHGVKVVVDGLNGQEIDRVEDCRTVAKDSAEYRMIMSECKMYGKIVGTVNEF